MHGNMPSRNSYMATHFEQIAHFSDVEAKTGARALHFMCLSRNFIKAQAKKDAVSKGALGKDIQIPALHLYRACSTALPRVQTC